MSLSKCEACGRAYYYSSRHPTICAECEDRVQDAFEARGKGKAVANPFDIGALTAAERKTYPVATGVLDYFPDALTLVAHVSFLGNEQHNPGTPVHWDRAKSQDEADALMRHFLARGTNDTDGVPHSAKMAWRALALLQKELEAR